MLHAVPELLDALEARLVAGDDPAELLSGIRWSELVGWPEDAVSAHALKLRLVGLQILIIGLQAPLRAALTGLSGSVAYGRGGIPASLNGLAPRLQERV
jgi:hypothetical protein